MANDRSFGGGAAQFPFELDSQAGVTRLLTSVRASDITSAQKNELRDLVLLYVNGGRDESVRISLEQKINAYGVSPVGPASTATESSRQPVHPFGTVRPVPRFTAPPAPAERPAESPSTTQPPQQPAPAEVSEDVRTAPPVAASAPVTSNTPPPPQAEVPAPDPAPVTAPAAPVAPSEPAASVPTQAAPATQQSAQPEPPVAPRASETPASPVAAPTPSADPAPPATNTTAYDPDQNLRRIREIKSLVNERVGNPVNLVDIDNTVGREYMSALLDAMKKLNSGSSVVSAMQRLEKAYEAVDKVITDHRPDQVEATEPSQPTTPAPQQSDPHGPAEETQSRPSDPADQSQPPRVLPIEQVEQEESVPSAAPEPVVAKPPPSPEPPPIPAAPSPPPPAPKSDTGAVTRDEGQQTATPTRVVPAGKPTAAPEQHGQQPVQSAWGPETDTHGISNQPPPAATRTKQETAQKPKITSVADSGEKLRTPSELPEASAIETSSVAGDPLYTKEVDEGLQQLLSEWSLFKKSGFFGTGPNGREHPLFKKISGLQIPLLLAGRFEGATQEIKQSITDYMNGWRYEQGIVYQPGEDFEHYLRRVIRHILDLQKRKQGA